VVFVFRVHHGSVNRVATFVLDFVIVRYGVLAGDVTRRLITPPSKSRASARVVFPEPELPNSARFRI
jgi:hypothetical protein